MQFKTYEKNEHTSLTNVQNYKHPLYKAEKYVMVSMGLQSVIVPSLKFQ